MKILKLLLLALGIIGLGVGGWYLLQTWLEVRNLWAVSNALRSPVSPNPTPMVLLTAGIAALGGLLLGVGIGLPARSQAAVRRQALQDASDAREASIRSRVLGEDHPASDEETAAESVAAEKEQA